MANLADKIKKMVQGAKMVGKIDLDSIPDKTRPDALSQEAKKANRKYMANLHGLRDKIHNLDIVIQDLNAQYDDEKVCQLAAERKRKELRRQYLEKLIEIRAKYDNVTLNYTERQQQLQLQGIRPSHMDVVHFHIPITKTNKEVIDGVAVVRNENRYYLAVDLYDQPDREDNITTILDKNPDGTFEGIWPKYTILKAPQKFEEKYMRNIVDKYADEIEKARAFIDQQCEKDLKEYDLLEVEIKELTRRIDEYGEIDQKRQSKQKSQDDLIKQLNDLLAAPPDGSVPDGTAVGLPAAPSETTAEPAPVSDASASDSPVLEVFPLPAPEPIPDVPADTPVLDFCVDDINDSSYAVLPPKMRDTIVRRLAPPEFTETEKRYRHLAYIRLKRELQDMSYPFIDLEFKSWLRFRLMGNIARLFNRVGRRKSLTHVLSQEYFNELTHRARTAYRGRTPSDVVPRGEMISGVIVFPHQGFEDTIIYDINNSCGLMLVFAYIREGRLMFYESCSEQQILGEPRIDNFLCKSMREAGTDATRIFLFVRNLVVSFLAMEHDMERTMKHFLDDGQAEEVVREVSVHDMLPCDNDEDVVIRDSNWYSSISVDHLIPVQGYLSHRWVGKGNDKVLREVWVRPHSRNGYHREAGVAKSDNN